MYYYCIHIHNPSIYSFIICYVYLPDVFFPKISPTEKYTLVNYYSKHNYH